MNFFKVPVDILESSLLGLFFDLLLGGVVLDLEIELNFGALNIGFDGALELAHFVTSNGFCFMSAIEEAIDQGQLEWRIANECCRPGWEINLEEVAGNHLAASQAARNAGQFWIDLDPECTDMRRHGLKESPRAAGRVDNHISCAQIRKVLPNQAFSDPRRRGVLIQRFLLTHLAASLSF
ncbi:TPA: hypothetical protein ACQQ5N_002694 [Pseudomonas aeruginosa]|uniref:hypothetical protein n=1 Tax=Pseudomonas aeruginosa TaxID=287 RepID=UPI001CBEBB39|nr:hypothetical protein [Pseudomonas aeruginosa]MBZ3679490.1 hypothetical protein [Pseudomonas aeruginosa]MBZ3690910.1 hypothetical protein [Pseudomonas aeruginosa]